MHSWPNMHPAIALRVGHTTLTAERKKKSPSAYPSFLSLALITIDRAEISADLNPVQNVE